ncbi:MAG: thiamine-phosphate kinase [Rudaea sp.]|uniref:thiamine-phosphate kinase n=1 Tax=Rudaea sp. TaxID=2136325 RepID=UPI0039E4DB19
MAEFELIDLIRTRCAVTREDVRLGIGDDAALLAVPAGQALAVSTDTLVSGIHFPKSTLPSDIGWKSLAVNLSDLAAMGAAPAWATLALTLPQADREWVAAFADGFAALAREFDLALVGGDTTQGPLSITVTVHGFVPEALALRRDGAKPGDGVFVTGTLGDAAAGLRLLESPSAIGKGKEHFVARLHRPTPRLAQGLLLRGRAHACIDVSDGLVADLGHVGKASGVGAEIDLTLLPGSPALREAFAAAARAPLQLAGGDDYELCFTAPATVADALLGELARSGCAATRIGRIVAAPGVRVCDVHGRLHEPPRAGWQHFSP